MTLNGNLLLAGDERRGRGPAFRAFDPSTNEAIDGPRRPFPATSDGRSTSVGTAAIERFLRPVCFQNLPDALLPAVLQRANPKALQRRVAGQPSNAPG